MNSKLIFLALPFLSLFAIPVTAEAGHGYGYGGYYVGHGYGYGHRSFSQSRHRSPAFDYDNGGRGYYRDSGHGNYRTYRIYRNYGVDSKKSVPSVRAVKKGSLSTGIQSIFRKGARR